MSAVEVPEEAVGIAINGRRWDPTITYAEDAARTDYITITTFVPLEQEQHEELADLGVQIQEQVDTDTYLCRYEPSDLEPIRDKPYIRQADVFRSKFKIVSDLKKTSVAAEDGIAVPTAGLSNTEAVKSVDDCTVDIVLHHGLEAGDVLSELAQEAQIDIGTIEYSTRKLRMNVDRSRLKLLATHDCVRAIEEVLPKVVHNNYAREIMEADIILNNTPYHGEGQIVTVSDTGFDRGKTDGCHQAFTDRVKALIPLIRKTPVPDNTNDPFGKGNPDNVNDPHGHGTHVCGSVLGHNLNSTLYPQGSIGGIAPKSELVLNSLYYSVGELIRTPLDLTDMLFDPPYEKHGSRIFSNSWGETYDSVIGQRAYNINDAEEVDEFIWRTKDAVVLFSAGNDNVTAKGNAAIGAQAAAKNCITVGATGSPREFSGKLTGIEQMADISSIGPTREGRIKPDVVAPGANILSTCSQHPKLQRDQAAVANYRKIPRDPLFEIKSGTSMATPLVAGCAAIVREVLDKQGISEPSAALVKALIINGAKRMPEIALNAQGFGRVSLKNTVAILIAGADHQTSAYSSLPSTGFREGLPLKQGDKAEFTVTLPKGASNFKVTMAYTDPPGQMLQNNLNLIVTTADGEERHGNGLDGDRYDELNNVEQTEILGAIEGEIKVIVWAQKITAMGGEQPFGLAWTSG